MGVDMDQAFSLLRNFARNRNLRLSDLAQAFIDGSETLASLTATRRAQPPLRGAGQPRHQAGPGLAQRP